MCVTVNIWMYEEERESREIIQSVLYAVLLTGSQLCRQGVGVHATAGSSGPPPSPPPSLPALVASAPQQ